MENDKLKYADERDKSYGIAGMAIAVVAYDSESMLASVSMDAEPGHAVEFGSEFYFSGNPRLSAKIAWTEIIKHFRLATGLLVANAMSRHYVQHRRRLPADGACAAHNGGSWHWPPEAPWQAGNALLSPSTLSWPKGADYR